MKKFKGFLKAWSAQLSEDFKYTDLMAVVLLAALIFEAIVLLGTGVVPDWLLLVVWAPLIALSDMTIFYFKEYRGSDDKNR